MSKKSEPARDPNLLSEDWQSRLKRMKDYQSENSADWSTNERLLVGDTTGVEADGLPKGAGFKAKGLAYAWGLVNALISEIYAQNPTLVADPYNPEFRDVARLVSRVAQSDLELMEVEEVLQDAITDSFPCGYGAVIEVVENYVSTRIDKDGTELPSLDGQDFELRRLHPNDVLFDPAGRRMDLSDHRWLGIRFYPTIGALKKRKEKDGWVLPDKLDETPEAIPEVRGNNRMEMTTTQLQAGTHQEKDPDARQVSVVELHDKTKMKIQYVLEHTGFVMKEKPWPFNLRIGARSYFPVTLVWFNKKTTGFYPVPELTFVRPQLLELADLARKMREASANQYRKVATLAEFIDPTQKEEIVDQTKPWNLLTLDRKAVAEFFGEDSLKDFDIRRVLQVFDDLMVSRDHMARYQMVQQDIEHILGYGPSNRGGMPRVRSAREAVIINDANQGKLATKISKIEKSFRLIAQKHLMILQQIQSTERYARNFPELADYMPFLSYDKEAIKGDFNFRVFGGSSAPKNTDAKKAQAREIWQFMAPVFQATQQDLRPLVQIIADSHGWPELVDGIYKNVHKEIIALAALSFSVQKQGGDPKQLFEAVARVVQLELSAQELQLIAQKISQQPQAGGPPGQVPPPALMQGRGDPDPSGTAGGI